jgi:hypothetical protein
LSKKDMPTDVVPTVLNRFSAILFIAVILAGTNVCAQVYPQAPQGSTSWDLVDAAAAGSRAGFVRVPAGNSGAVDSYGFCRWVTNSNGHEYVIPVSTSNEWQYFRAGEFNGSPPPGIGEVVCCRPQTVSLCGGAIQMTLPYTAYQGTQSYTQNCGAYTETQSWTCNSTLPATPNAAFADGAWQESADTDVQNCTANWQSVYQGCTAGCNQYGSYQYYKYDANSCPGDNAYTSYSGSCYGGNCCQPVKVGCSGSTAIMSCGPNVPGGCSYQLVGGSSCSYGSHISYAGNVASGNYTEYLDCANPWTPGAWGTTSGPGVSCSTVYGNEPVYIYVNNALYKYTTTPSVDGSNCYAYQ